MTYNTPTRSKLSLVSAVVWIAIGSGCSSDGDDRLSHAVERDAAAANARGSDEDEVDTPRAPRMDPGAAGSSAAAAGNTEAPEPEKAQPESPKSTGDDRAGAPATSERPKGVTVTGVVVDVSNGDPARNFDHTKYPAIAGVKVCVHEHADIPCVTTDSEGKYALGGLPENLDVYLSYEKESLAPMLFKPVPGTGSEMPAMLLVSSEYRDSFAKAGGIQPEPSTGLIYFGANLLESRGTMYHQKFGTAERYYLKAYSVSVWPAAKAGPVYVSSHWQADARLKESSAAGWGIIQAAPGDYTLSFEHPSLTCPTATAKVLPGYITIYASVLCSVGDADAGI